MASYEIRFYGDLKGQSVSYSSLEDALNNLSREWGWIGQHEIKDSYGNTIGYTAKFTPDPEDDRVVVWEHKAGYESVAVWHFSGWHWSFDAEDLPGGPLDQGVLPTDIPFYKEKALYTIAMEEY